MVPSPLFQRLGSLFLWKLTNDRSFCCFESWKGRRWWNRPEYSLPVGTHESDPAKGQNRRSSLGKQDMLSLSPLADLLSERAKVGSMSGQWNKHEGCWKLRELPGFGKEQSNDIAVFKRLSEMVIILQRLIHSQSVLHCLSGLPAVNIH